MRVPHNSAVLVADGAKMLFFRNEGDADALNLQPILAEEQRHDRDRDIKTGPSGRASSPQGPSGSVMGEADFHDQNEERFAVAAAEMLKTRALAGEYETLIIAAPPRTLGVLRKHYHPEIEKRLVGEVNKDLTRHPVDEIEKIIANA